MTNSKTKKKNKYPSDKELLEKLRLYNRCKSHTSLYRSSSVLSIRKENRVS